MRGLVVYSPDDSGVSAIVSDFSLRGVPATTKLPRLLAERERGLDFIVLTPSVLPAVDSRAVGFLYADGAMLVGLNVHASELQTLVFGSASSGMRAPYDTFFSMIHEDVSPGGCGGAGSFEDGVENWDVAGFVLHRAREAALARNSCQ